MKRINKLKRQAKKRQLEVLSSITAVLMLIAGSKLAGFSAPVKALEDIKSYVSTAFSNDRNVSKTNNQSDTNLLANNSGARLQDTDTITYIYNTEDLAKFRDKVNEGDNYEGKIVYLMNDIDLSTVCSENSGVSWKPIGAGGKNFAGTFDGNYHTISNLYINSNEFQFTGLFRELSASGIIQNLLLEDIYVCNYYDVAEVDQGVGGILGLNYGTLLNCGVKSGTVIGRKVTKNTISNSWPGPRVGGVVSYNYGLISGCYNRATVTSYGSKEGSLNETYAGGIAGGNVCKIENCYNAGTITADAYYIYVGGIFGSGHRGIVSGDVYIKNSYNIGSVFGTAHTTSSTYCKVGGVFGRTGWSSSYTAMERSNNYCISNTQYSYSYLYSGSTYRTSTEGMVSEATLKTYTAQLLSAFDYDVYNTNNGYPVLEWENKRPIMRFDKNQEYIKVNEHLQLNIMKDEDVLEIIGNNFKTTDFDWVSTNKDIATVSSTGMVTGLKDGYTTIYAHHRESGMYAMCIINVANNFATPQIETGNGFTVILKSDGTVLTIGNNASGTLGNGTNVDSKEAVNVYKDKDTILNNIIKISVGPDFAIALAKDGRVYAWGANDDGQLGKNDKEDSNYAKLVLGEDGETCLTNIVDISAGYFGATAIDKSGNLYVWGRGNYGELGDRTQNSSDIPVKVEKIKSAIKTEMGYEHVVVLTSDGVVLTWGYNSDGQLGINCTGSYTAYPRKTAIETTDIAAGAAFTTIRKTDNKLYTVGAYTNGRLGTGSQSSEKIYVEVKLPDIVNESNKVKYFKAGRMNTILLLQDGTVWETGFNLHGELGNGKTTTSTTFVQGLTAEGTPITDVLTIGKNKGISNGSVEIGYGLNTAVILENGDVYTTGNNTYGQIGNNSTDNVSYYTKMYYAYLDYEDKSVEVDENGYQIQLEKVKYIQSVVNVYNENKFTIGELKYTSLNENLVTVDDKGKVTAKEGVSGGARIKIEDITNGYETYFTVIVNKMENTDTITYIYSSEDLKKFRDTVNGGDNYEGKSVYVMADIDMSDVCSESKGSWIPIGTTETYFAGNFDGNYHTISNLYYNDSQYVCSGLFARITDTAVVQNLLLDNVYINNTYNIVTNDSYIGGIVGINYGKVLNCGITSGNITGRKTSVNTIRNSWPGPRVGGITGWNYGLISACHNKATISSYGPTANSENEIFAGGIAGANVKQIESCYNTGSVTGSSYSVYIGGIIGHAQTGTMTGDIYLKNSYNIGSITATGKNVMIGGVAGRTGWNSTYRAITMTNNYCTTETRYDYSYYSGSSYSYSTKGRVEKEILKTYTSKLGQAYEEDSWNINEGYPILWWEAPTVELTKKQVYIGKNEELQLNIIINGTVGKALGEGVTVNDFDWTSSNEDIATVNSNALVKGVSEGYTTIYGKYKSEQEKELYVMCIVNVARNENIATPQIETGENFTAILKPDGTVWTIGNNDYGQLGQGYIENIDTLGVNIASAQQVKISDTEYLKNIVKISVGTHHVLALTKEGEVYAWGDNTYGQLGTGSKVEENETASGDTNAKYATKVSGEGGSGALERIIDISAGNFGSSAVNEFGWVYVWGNGTYGEMGNGNITSNIVPIKSTIGNAISISSGAGHNVVLSQSGKAYTWGRNTYGELGIGSLVNNTIVSEIANKITEISASGYETVIKDVDKNVYVCGLNTSGQLGTGTSSNVVVLTKTNLPEETIENPVKYIKAGRGGITLQLKDDSVYTVGINTRGELGNGEINNSTKFVRAQIYMTEVEEKYLESTLMIGRSSGENTSLNIATINKNGRIYTSGANTNGQIGNNTLDDVNYFTEMGYIKANYPKKIEMRVGETKQLTKEELSYVETYFNVYKEDINTISLSNKAIIQDSNIATFEEGTLEGVSLGNTILMVKEESTGTVIYIPVKVLPRDAQGTFVPDVKTGDNFTISLKSDGTVWSFGANENGELGLGDKIYRNVPKQVDIVKRENIEQETVPESNADLDNEQNNNDVSEGIICQKIEQIEIGNNHVIVLTEDGEVYAWGLNSNGQLGNGTKVNSNVPQKVMIPEGTELVKVVEDTIVKVIANKNVSFAITQSGKLYAWGEGYGVNPVLVEKTVENSDEVSKTIDIIDISKNYALDIEGNVYDLNTKKRLEIVEKIVYISEGTNHTVFLSENGTGYATGSNTFGQYGDGTYVTDEGVVAIRNEDAKEILNNIVKLEAGDGYTVAVLKDGTLLEWGVNRAGQLGKTQEELQEINKPSTNEKVAKLVHDTKEGIMLMDAGEDHVAIALTDGNVYAWGLNTDGELGNGTNDNSVEPKLVGKNIVETNTNNLVLSEKDTFSIEGKTTYFNLIKEVGNEIIYESKDTAVMTVNSSSGEATALKQGKTVIVARERDTQNISVIQVRVLPEGIKIEPEVVTNGSHTVTLKVDGTVWCYGNNTHGELGNGTTNYSDEPVQAIFPDDTTIIQIGAGENFSIALDSDGNVWTWGSNNYGQLGVGSVGAGLASAKDCPQKVPNLSNITKIACGTYSVLAIDKNKDVYGWGLNSNGELGIGSYTNIVNSPIKAKHISDIIDIEIGKNHAIALRTTGEVYVTGLNLYGQLGNDDKTIKKVSQFTKVKGVKDVARISTTDSGNIVSTINGKVYSWGLNIYGELGLGDKDNRSVPTLVNELNNIVDIDGGKNHAIALDKNGKVYLTGSNRYGQLGKGTTEEGIRYETIEIDNVMTVSAGNTYTVLAKTDGTVWGFGDYNHGDKKLKSKTCSLIPIQVGNDAFGLGVRKVTVRKSQTVSISQYIAYSFNLINLDENKRESMRYESLNEEIAKVNQYGEILGEREGFTWIKAIEENGKEHVVFVYVIDNKTNEKGEYTSQYAPSISAGENFAGVLKSDGTIWTFGHNNNGELGIGSNRTKDVPERTNINASYKEISTGNSFTVALRNDGTVWSYGQNNYGQLGVGDKKNILSPVEIGGLRDIVQIAVGKDHVVAIDSYGILYGWGRNSNGQLGTGTKEKIITSPIMIPYTQGSIGSIWAGENETIIIDTKGKVHGYGDLLNGELGEIEDAVKVSVGKGYMLILTSDGEVYKYDGNAVSKINILENIVDIDVTNTNNIAQTKEEKVYTWTENTEPTQEVMEKIYTIGAGVNNSYVILTNGTVYAKGNNKYGQLGNSTRDNSEIFTLVGDREFIIKPESDVMYENDREDLTEEMIINEFNVFNDKVRNASEYTWESSIPEVVEVKDGVLTAKTEGTAEITVRDKVTGAEVKLVRVVMPLERDRIASIKVDDNEATVEEQYKYYVEVETDGNTGTLVIDTKNKDDQISINNGETWSENGTLRETINITSEETEIKIKVKTSNGAEIEYTLRVKKISKDASLLSIKVDGESAIPISSTTYEIVVKQDVSLSEIIAIANNAKAEVSIDGEEFKRSKATTKVEYGNRLLVEVPITVIAENGEEIEYELKIYKESTALELESLIVEEREAIKTSETVYSVTIPREINSAEIVAKALADLVDVSINNEESEVKISTRKVIIEEEKTEVIIRVSTTLEGEEIYRDYTLNIYKKQESGKIQFVIVNRQVVELKSDRTYEIYLPLETMEAEVRVIAENEEDYVQIDNNEKTKTITIAKVDTKADVNEYRIKVYTEDTEEYEEYTLYIKKPSQDATLKEITVSNEEYTVTAKKSAQEQNVYIAKVLRYDEYTVKAITSNKNAYVKLGEDGEKIKNIATKIVENTLEENDEGYIEVKISVESENGDTEEYTLKIYVMSGDAELEFIDVNGTRAEKQEDGTYLVNLRDALSEVEVKAGAISEEASIKIDDNTFNKHVTTEKVIIDSKETTCTIYVQSEDGKTTNKYTLRITGLPDDATLEKVTVNGKDARYIEGENKYEIRLDEENFEIEAIATDSLAKVKLNEQAESQGRSTITIEKSKDGITIVTIKVIAQDGVDSTEYTLEIKEKSDDASIANIIVNEKQATRNEEGNYISSISAKEDFAVIKVQANDSYAVVYLEEETQNADNITVKKEISGRKTEYTIKVVAEDGTTNTCTLTIIKLSDNTNIEKLTVKTTKENQNEDTGEVTTETKTEEITKQDDGTYYLKIDRVEHVDVKAILEDVNASVKIKNSSYALHENEETVITVAEKTTIIISVQAEDGTIQNYTLTLEKKSNDTSISIIETEDMIKVENSKIYVDEDLESIDLTVVTNSEFAFIKWEEDANYTEKQITKLIDLINTVKTEDDTEEGIPVKVEVQAEDGTIHEYIIRIIKVGNTKLTSVKVEEEDIPNVEDVYSALINVTPTAKVEITAEKEETTIQIIKVTTNEEGEETEEVINTNKGTLIVDELPLKENPQDYKIRVISAKGSTTYDYKLIIQQKSIDTSIMYVKVDNESAIEKNEEYRISVSKKDTYPVQIRLNDEKAEVKISYNYYVGEEEKTYEGKYAQGRLLEEVAVAVGETLEVTITVKAENGNEKEYKLYITRISDNTGLEYVTVNGETVTDFDEETNTYSAIVDSDITQANLVVKAVSDKANLTIGSETKPSIIETTLVLEEEETKVVMVKVEAQDGTMEEYFINIRRLSANISLQDVTVNGVEATRGNDYNYEVTITDEKDTAEVIARATSSTSSVSIGGDEAIEGASTKEINIGNQKTIETTILVIAEDGTEQEYKLTINIIDSSNEVEYVKVNEGYIDTENSKKYETFIPTKSESAEIEIKAKSEYANIKVTNAEEIEIIGEDSKVEGESILKFIVKTPEDVTTINYTVTSEAGEAKEYTIILTKLSDDNSLKELRVDNDVIEANERGIYYATFDNARQVVVKAITSNQYAKVRIDYGDEKQNETEATIDANTSSRKVIITVTSQSGITAKYYLYIRILEDNTEIDRILVDSIEVEDYDEKTKTYTAVVDDSKQIYEAFFMAVNNQTTIELYDDDSLLARGEADGNLSTTVTLLPNEEVHNYRVKVSLDEERYSEYTLEVLRISSDTSLRIVEVNDVIRQPKSDDKYVYEVGIPKLADTANIRVETTNKFAKVQISDNETVRNGQETTIKLKLEENRITVPVVVTAVDGCTIDTFNIILIRQSNNTDLSKIVVNDNEVENVENVYTYYMSKEDDNAHVEIFASAEGASIEVEEKTGVGYLEFDEPFGEETIKVEKTIKITSEDGSSEEFYTLILYKKTQIEGIITTENFEEKYMSRVKLYKRKRKAEGEDEGHQERELIENIETEENGSFVMEIDEVGTYDVIVEKPGYLTYTVANIEITPGLIVEIQEYKLVAGDVAEDGEIEIDDLVDLGDNIGEVITEENKLEKSKYDLNEDNIVDNTDLEILQKNYGKKAETLEWVNPTASNEISLMNVVGADEARIAYPSETFVLPINCEYRITSKYGYRINPVTKENKLHAGIDLVGEHHAEILSIADGEITYAGVQNGYGNCVEIKHIVNGETIYSFYAHLSRIDVKVGEKVTQGKVIGLEGGAESDANHGTSTGHHLHFEIRTASGSGHSVDPTKYVDFGSN